LGVHRRQSRRQHQGVDAKQVGTYEQVPNDIKCLRTTIERLKGGGDVFASLDKAITAGRERVEAVEATVALKRRTKLSG
jgi:hypothetical protein